MKNQGLVNESLFLSSSYENHDAYLKAGKSNARKSFAD